MKRTGDDYLDSLHLADIQVLSTLGLTDEDIAALRAQDKVEDAEGEYVIDAFASSDSLDAVVKVLSLTGRGINEVLLRDGQVFEIDGIKIECFLAPGHTWGHMVYLIDDRYLFTGDTIWFGADGGYSFISALAEDNRLAVRSLAELETKLEARKLHPMFLTGHTGWTDDLYFAFAHRDKLCSPFKKKVHDPSAPYDAYDESDDTEENAKRGFLPPVQKI